MPRGSIMPVTNPLGTHGTGITQLGISNPYSSLHAVTAVTYRHSGESPPLWLKRCEYPWTKRTFLTGLLMFSFLILKNFSWVLGSLPPTPPCRLCFLQAARGLFTPNLQHVKRERRKRVGGERKTPPQWERRNLPVWLLCACESEARQRDSSRLHTPTPQMQGPRSRILQEKQTNEKYNKKSSWGEVSCQMLTQPKAKNP